MELLAGVGIGLVGGFVLFAVGGQWLFRTALGAITDAISKITYSVRYPTPETTPMQTEHLESEEAFDTMESDTDRVPSWMDEEYELGRQ